VLHKEDALDGHGGIGVDDLRLVAEMWDEEREDGDELLLSELGAALV
jgi:hypothetical protein